MSALLRVRVDLNAQIGLFHLLYQLIMPVECCRVENYL